MAGRALPAVKPTGGGSNVGYADFAVIHYGPHNAALGASEASLATAPTIKGMSFRGELFSTSLSLRICVVPDLDRIPIFL